MQRFVGRTCLTEKMGCAKVLRQEKVWWTLGVCGCRQGWHLFVLSTLCLPPTYMSGLEDPSEAIRTYHVQGRERVRFIQSCPWCKSLMFWLEAFPIGRVKTHICSWIWGRNGDYGGLRRPPHSWPGQPASGQVEPGSPGAQCTTSDHSM